MNTLDMIELPPLPQGEYRLSPDSRAPTLYDKEAMEAYALAAIKADRQRRGVNSTRTLGEPECNHCGGTGDVSGEYPGIACPDCAGTGKAPQPAEPVTCFKCGHPTHRGECVNVAPQPAEPVDISAFDELIDLYQDAQRDGTFKERIKARTELREAYRKALAHPAEPVKVNAVFETENGEVIGTTDAKVKRVEWQDDGSLTVVIDYWPQPAEPVDETLICTLDGYQFYLGPEYDGELEWDDAKKWCESLGENYELPNRLVMLAICMNEATAALLTEDSYWTSTEFEGDPFYAAWLQEWSSGSPGLQGYASKSHLYRARAVRRCRL